MQREDKLVSGHRLPCKLPPQRRLRPARTRLLRAHPGPFLSPVSRHRGFRACTRRALCSEPPPPRTVSVPDGVGEGRPARPDACGL